MNHIISHILDISIFMQLQHCTKCIYHRRNHIAPHNRLSNKTPDGSCGQFLHFFLNSQNTTIESCCNNVLSLYGAKHKSIQDVPRKNEVENISEALIYHNFLERH